MVASEAITNNASIPIDSSAISTDLTNIIEKNC